MAKSEMSSGFAKFAAKTTKGKYDEARKGERMGRGIPYPIGTTGTAVVAAVICTETKADNEGVKSPMVRVELKIETPEPMRGKALSGNGLMQVIKDGPNPEKWSADMAWGAMLGMLENLGCPEEITKGYSDFQECIDWFEQEPRYVNWEVIDASYQKAGKTIAQKGIQAFAVIKEGDAPTADSGDKPEDDPDASYCTYRGARHMILENNKGLLKLKNMNNGNVRNNIEEDAVEMED
jgi:hypothetical protein